MDGCIVIKFSIWKCHLFRQFIKCKCGVPSSRHLFFSRYKLLLEVEKQKISAKKSNRAYRRLKRMIGFLFLLILCSIAFARVLPVVIIAFFSSNSLKLWSFHWWSFTLVLYVCWKKENCTENVNIANFRRPAKEKSLTFSLFSRPKV